MTTSAPVIVRGRSRARTLSALHLLVTADRPDPKEAAMNDLTDSPHAALVAAHAEAHGRPLIPMIGVANVGPAIFEDVESSLSEAGWFPGTTLVRSNAHVVVVFVFDEACTTAQDCVEAIEFVSGASASLVQVCEP